MSDYQEAIDNVEQLDIDPDAFTTLLIPVYSASEAEDRGGYDNLVAARGEPEDRNLLEVAGLAETTAELREEGLPLTENGAAIHHYYHEVGKNDAEAEKQLNENPTEFARQAFQWWYNEGRNDTDI
ncbi:hypothetical protein [Halococcus sediminicola]|uniref:hypothetical protein n=1 Tax=Halococcus sediminicola TaxID=1264579 RepID=UPI0012ABE257|nr:hypothetical protein [Halococcus sediminicola]